MTRSSSIASTSHIPARSKAPVTEIIYTHRVQGVGAEGVHVMGMAEAFRAAGHEVRMDCPAGCNPFDRDRVGPADGPDGEAAKGDGSRFRIFYRRVAECSPEAVFGALELLYNIPLLARLGRKLLRRPGLVYERYALGTFAPALLCRAFGIPRVVEVNDSVVVERHRPPSWAWIKRRLERQILGSADLVVTVSGDFGARLSDAYPSLPREKILVLPNAVSEERFVAPPVEATRALRDRLGLGSRSLLGTAGQFLEWHGLAPFVAATASLARERDLGYLFIGDGPARPAIIAAARAAGVEDRVTFTGMIPHSAVADHLALLDIAVIPSAAAHASPMKLMEFMAMGLPIVAPDLDNIREVLEDGRTGLLFRAGDMDDLRRRLDEMLDGGEAPRELGLRAREYVRSNLTWGGHAREVLERLGLP